MTINSIDVSESPLKCNAEHCPLLTFKSWFSDGQIKIRSNFNHAKDNILFTLVCMSWSSIIPCLICNYRIKNKCALKQNAVCLNRYINGEHLSCCSTLNCAINHGFSVFSSFETVLSKMTCPHTRETCTAFTVTLMTLLLLKMQI